MRVLSTGRFSLLVVKGVMVKEPQDWVLRLTLLSVGEQGLLAAEKNYKHLYFSLPFIPNRGQNKNLLLLQSRCWFAVGHENKPASLYANLTGKCSCYETGRKLIQTICTIRPTLLKEVIIHCNWLLSKVVLPGTDIYGLKVMMLLNFNNCGN